MRIGTFCFKLVLGAFLLCLGFVAKSQQLLVRENGSKLPIEDATIASQKYGSVEFTNQEGVAELNYYQVGDTLIIRHPSYQPLRLVCTPLDTPQHKVYLEERIFHFDEVVVSANKWEQQSSDLPQEVLSVKAKEIAYNTPQTAADLLSSTGEVFVQKSQMGGGSPMIRGFSANSLLIVLDGVRLNNAIYRSGNLQNVIMLDPNVMESAEVVFGPSSALYGSDALGGTMSFQTIEPVFSTEDKLSVSGKGMLRYASANHEKTGHFQASISSKKFSNVLAFTYSDFDDLRAGSNRPKDHPDFGKRFSYVEAINGEDVIVANDDVNLQVFTGYHQYNLMNKAALRLNNKSNLTYTLYHTNSSNIPRYDRLVEPGDDSLTFDNSEWYYGPQLFTMHSLKFSNYSQNLLYDGLKFTVSQQHVEESRHNRGYQSTNLNHRIEDVKVYAANLDLDKKFSKSTELFYGGEFVLNRVTSEAYREDINDGTESYLDTRYPNGGGRYWSWAAYATLHQEVSEKMMLTSGVRYTHTFLTAEFINDEFYDLPFEDISQYNGSISGNVGTVIKPNDNWRWNVLFSTGFRAPNLDDSGKVFDSGDVVVVPNENLEPEYSLNYETGLKWKYKELLHLEGVIYYTRLLNAMEQRAFEFNGIDSIFYDGGQFPMAALVNVGQAYIWGYSLSAQYFMTKTIGMSANVTYTNGMDLDDNLPLRHVTPVFGKGSIIYKKSKLKAEAYVNFQGAIAFEDLAPSEQSKDYLYSEDGALSWYTINLRSSYQFNRKWSMTAAVENILDTHYRTYSSGVSAAGINGVVSLSKIF